MMAKFDMEHRITKLPDFWLHAFNTCCFVTLKMTYVLNRFLEGRSIIQLLFEWKMGNVMDGIVMHIAVSTEEAMEGLRPASKDGRIV